MAVAVLAETIDDRTVTFEQGIAHPLVNGLEIVVFVDHPGATPVILEEVHAPRRECFGILLFVAVAARVLPARTRSR